MWIPPSPPRRRRSTLVLVVAGLAVLVLLGAGVAAGAAWQARHGGTGPMAAPASEPTRAAPSDVEAEPTDGVEATRDEPLPVALGPEWSTALLTDRAANWDRVAGALPVVPIGDGQVGFAAGEDSAGLRALTRDLVEGRDDHVPASCLSHPTSYVERSFLRPAIRSQVLATLAGSPVANPAGWVWKGRHLSVFVSFAEYRADYACPDVHLNEEFENVRPADVEWAVYRYLDGQGQADDAASALVCTNLEGNRGWDPLGTVDGTGEGAGDGAREGTAGGTTDPSQVVIPLTRSGEVLDGTGASLSGPPSLAVGARDVGGGFTYYLATGTIPVDGELRTATFVLGSLWMPPNPCLGDAYLGTPQELAARH